MNLDVKGKGKEDGGHQEGNRLSCPRHQSRRKSKTLVSQN